MTRANKTSRKPDPGKPSIGFRLQVLEAMLPEAMAHERYHAGREIGHIRDQVRQRRRVKRLDTRLQEIEQRLARSAQTRAKRANALPSWAPLESLPITDRQAAIVAAIKTHPVVIVAGETGSGKTTQLPKFCMAAGRGLSGMIGCTQPRRIAATTVAQRIADELGEPLGGSVGYKIRFQDRTRRESFIKIMTDGILLAETQGDPSLTAYDTLIIDEAHERSLNIDFLLGILKKLVQRRKDLKLIITSATIDTEKFAQAFDDAPIIGVSGRMYPVEVRYRPMADDGAEGRDETHVEAAVTAVEGLLRESVRGDVLVFMPTEQDIRETCELLAGRGLAKTDIMPLYARLAAADQHRVFAGSGARKIIVATNVAETSITIPGIRYVVDTGLARIPRYSPRTRTTALPVASIARSSADQRMGRCGRVANGICVRLYGEDNYQGRPRFTPPEILRANLAEVILRMISLKLGDISTFPFIDPPDPRSVRDGLNLLVELEAVEKDDTRAHRKGLERYRLTARGRIMARMPIDPRLSRMLIEARQHGCLPSLLVIAAVLSIQDPRERPMDKEQAADQAHAVFKDPASDFVTLLNIWERSRDIVRTGPLKRFCRTHFLSFRRIREWRDIHRQLKTIAAEAGLDQDQAPPSAAADSRNETFGALYTAIHMSVLCGFLANIAQRKEKNIYRAARGRECMIFPGSGLFNRSGEWVVAAELVHTSRLFARMVANIDSAWIETLAGDQCRHTYLAPRWSRKRGQVVADEQISLYGLTIIEGRRVSYAPIAPEEAAEIFVRRALIGGDVRQPLPFMGHNQALIDDVTDMENRLRRRGLLVDEEILYQFYRDRLGTMADMRSLAYQIKKKGGDHFLRLQPEDLLQTTPDADELAMYPVEVEMGSARLKADYRFNPGREDDGITVAVPAARVHQVNSAEADWLVPGLLEEKIAALLKALPKAYRRQLVPVSDTAAIVAREMPRSPEGLPTALGNFIHRRFKVDIPATAWAETELPAHLKMRFAVMGPDGETIAVDRDAEVLKKVLPPSPRKALLTDVRQRWERDGITTWDFGDLPSNVAADTDNASDYWFFPALVRPKAGHKGVGLRLYNTHEEALKTHCDGVAALLEIVMANDLHHLKRQLRLPAETAQRVRFAGGVQALERQLYARVVRDRLCCDLRTAEAFAQHAAAVRRQLMTDVQALIKAIAPVVTAYDEVREVLFGLERQVGGRGVVADFLLDRREDIHKLVPDNFVAIYERERFQHLPRYLKAMGIRARKAVQQFERDRSKADEINRFEKTLQHFLEQLTPRTSARKRTSLEDFFWLIEEYKVSLFAQELKTAVPVSAKRLEKKIGEISRML